MTTPKKQKSAPMPPPLPEDLGLREGQSLELLKELHILTREGRLNQDSRRKLKQVYHLYQFIEPLLEEVLSRQQTLTLADHGAGKSYLGFILYDLFCRPRANGKIYGIETRQPLVERSRALAEHFGFSGTDYTGMHFVNTTVDESRGNPDLPERFDVVTALHACNTATDDAIRFALEKKAHHIVLVPCCQAEVAATLRKHKNTSLSQTSLSELWRHPIHSRELGSHLTNVLRCLLLESQGYKVTVTELVGWEHSMKNELILASLNHGTHGQPRKNAKIRAQEILKSFHLEDLHDRFII